MRAKIIVSSFCILLLSVTLFSLKVNASSPLQLSLAIDQSVYRLLRTTPSTVNIAGNLTLDGVPVSDGLIAVTVFQGTINKYIRPILFRTLNTGSIPPQNWSLSIVSIETVKLNASGYVPQSVFKRPTTQQEPGPIINVTYTNVDYKSVAYLAITVVDADKVAIATRIMTLQPVSANSTFSVLTDEIFLSDWVALGTATVYACAFNNITPYLYFPYCPEASTQFEIVSSGGGALSSQENINILNEQTISSINGNYNLTFRINVYRDWPLYSPWGNYTVKVSSDYQGQQAINSYTFWMRIPGDANGNGIVNIGDAAFVGSFWRQTVPPADPGADYNGDGVISIPDVAIIGAYWGRREQF